MASKKNPAAPIVYKPKGKNPLNTVPNLGPSKKAPKKKK